MPADSITVHCGECEAELNESHEAPPESRAPCPRCGSLRREVRLYRSDSVRLYSRLDLKAREPGQSRPYMEQRVGDDLHRDSGVWMHLKRVIDRLRNRYIEHIRNPKTGEVVRDVDEPLDQHKGHGSAKGKR